MVSLVKRLLALVTISCLFLPALSACADTLEVSPDGPALDVTIADTGERVDDLWESVLEVTITAQDAA